MQEKTLKVTGIQPLAKNVFRLDLTGEDLERQRPGQFVNLRAEGCFLRRPISVYDWEEGRLSVIFKVVGGGTERLSALRPGDAVNALTGLGNGYDLSRAGEKPLLLGGGVGVPPLYLLAKELLAQGRTVTAVLGFNRAEEVFGEEEFRALGCETVVTTADGSRGLRGFVTDAMPEDYSFFYTCGPKPMLRAVWEKTKTGGQFSFEERMGCGFGACMGCTCKTKDGAKRICREGPVLDKEEILWED